jgi:hypothetical protein
MLLTTDKTEHTKRACSVRMGIRLVAAAIVYLVVSHLLEGILIKE